MAEGSHRQLAATMWPSATLPIANPTAGRWAPVCAGQPPHQVIAVDALGALGGFGVAAAALALAALALAALAAAAAGGVWLYGVDHGQHGGAAARLCNGPVHHVGMQQRAQHGAEHLHHALCTQRGAGAAGGSCRVEARGKSLLF